MTKKTPQRVAIDFNTEACDLIRDLDHAGHGLHFKFENGDLLLCFNKYFNTTYNAYVTVSNKNVQNNTYSLHVRNSSRINAGVAKKEFYGTMIPLRHALQNGLTTDVVYELVEKAVTPTGVRYTAVPRQDKYTTDYKQGYPGFCLA